MKCKIIISTYEQQAWIAEECVAENKPSQADSSDRMNTYNTCVV